MNNKIMLLLPAFLCSGLLIGCTPNDSVPAPTSVILPTVEESAPAEVIMQETVVTESNAINSEERTLSALNGQLPIITQSGQVVFLADYLIGYSNAVPLAYTFVDFDGDRQNEMVIETSAYDGLYVVLHCYDSDIFAFPFHVRSLHDLKQDGSFIGSNSAFSTEYLRMDFRGGGYIISREAYSDSTQSIYEIDGIPCSEHQFNLFISAWHTKEEPIWTTYNASTPNAEYFLLQPQPITPYLEPIELATQPIYKNPGYYSQFARYVDASGIYTIVEEQWDSAGHLWGKLKSGAGWVDLTDIRAYRSAHLPLTAYFSDAALIPDSSYYHCVTDTSEYMVRIVFTATENLHNVNFAPLSFVEDHYEMDESVFFIQELTFDTPFIADVSFPGDTSQFGIRFVDSYGSIRCFSVGMRGKDGSLTLSEIFPE